MIQHSICAGSGARLVILGFGCIGRGVLPLLRHIAIRPGQIRIVTDCIV